MSAKNNCTFIGNIGHDAEVRRTKSGMAIATFSLPFESGYGENKTTTWVRCSIFGKRAEGGLVQYLVKGQEVAVTGEIKLNQYTNKDGEEKSSLELNVADIGLVGGKKSSQQNQNKPDYRSDPFSDTKPRLDDDIPF